MKIIKEDFQVNSSLNPKLWEKSMLRPEVKEKLLEIVETFKDGLDVDLDIVDIQLVGSNASFNYTDNSDLDCHIIANFNTVSDDDTILNLLYNFYKTKFNTDHNISIHGVPVELYVQDVNSGITSNGIYSLLLDDWIKFPERIEPKEIDVREDVDFWVNEVDKAIANKDLERIYKIIDILYLIRRNGIAAEGEYSPENQTFKELRNLGILDKLKDNAKDIETERLTLESLKNN